jgi:hypothetical protein
MDEMDATLEPETLQTMERVERAPQTCEQGPRKQTRYAVVVGAWWVTAVMEGSGIGLTATREDAGTWVTYEKAVEVARLVTGKFGQQAWIEVIEEPHYPRTWRLR